MRPERGEPPAPVVLSPKGCVASSAMLGVGGVAELLSKEEGKIWESAWG